MFKFFLFLCLYIPFQLALNPMEGIDLASGRVLIIILFLFWLANGLKNKKVIIKNSLQTWLIAAFLLFSALSIAVAQNTDWSIRKLFFLLSIFPIYFVSSALVDDAEKAKKTARFIVAGGFMAAIIGIGQFLAQFIWGLEKTYQFWADYIIAPFLGKSFSQAVLQNPSWLVNISGNDFLRATSVFPDPHMLSFYLGMAGALCLGLILTAEKNKKFWWLALITILAADFLTFSRGGYLGIFCAIAALLFVFWRKASWKFKKIFLALGVVLLIILAVPNPVSQRFFSSFNLKEGSNAGRIEIWQQAMEVIKNNIGIGVGIGNYPLEIKPSADYREPIYAHNAYLDVAVEIGMFGILAWLGIILSAGMSFIKKSKTETFFIGGFLALVIFAAHSLVETAIYSSTVLPIFLIIISLSNIKNEGKNVSLREIPALPAGRWHSQKKNI